ncbi:MAG: lipocalin-like domain-containing protein [Pseudomonadota bacterium]
MTDYVSQFVGVWRAKDWTVTNLATGEQTKYFDGRAEGFIAYSAEGWVSSSVIDTGRPMNTSDRDARTDLKAAIEANGCANLTPQQYETLTPFALSALGYMGYCGFYSADAENVYHDVQSAGRPSHMDLRLARTYTFDGDTLRLTGDAVGFRDSILWERIRPPATQG